MPHYRIYWDIGFGRNSETIEADSQEQATDYAYEAAREDFEAQVSYGATLATDDDEDDE